MINFTVGPVQSNDAVLAIGSEQVPYFRTPEFSETMFECEKLMLEFSGAPEGSRVVFITGSGTASMEASVINTLTDDDKALVVNGGSFGERFAELLKLYDIPFDEISLEPGKTLTEEMVKQLSSFSSETKIVDFNKISPEIIDFKHFDIKSEEKAEESSTPKGNIIERCKNGEFIVPFEWNEDQKALIPPMDFLDLFVPSEEFEDALMEMKGYADRILRNIDLGKTGADAIGNNGKGFTFIGKPGTGKSTTTQAICAAMQMPYYMCTTTSGMEEDAFQGKVKLDHSDGNTGAAFKFCETQFLKAFEYGGLAVVEEFNLVPPEVIMGAIGQAIEKPFVLEKDGYIPIKRHPMCFIAFTCNVHMQGSKEPSGALVSRASNVFDISDPKEEDFIRILSKQTEGVSDKVVKSVFRAYKTTLNILAETMPDVAKNITLRQCLSALDQVSFGIPIKRAIKNSILNSLKVFISDEEVISDINEAVMTTIN